MAIAKGINQGRHSDDGPVDGERPVQKAVDGADRVEGDVAEVEYVVANDDVESDREEYVDADLVDEDVLPKALTCSGPTIATTRRTA